MDLLTSDAHGWRIGGSGSNRGVRASHPILHGVRADGERFSLPLVLDGARREQRQVSLPGAAYPWAQTSL